MIEILINLQLIKSYIKDSKSKQEVNENATINK